VGWPAASGEGDVTERDWLDATDSQGRLTFLRDSGKATQRKLWLLVAAVGRTSVLMSTDEALQQAFDVAERHADGRAGLEELEEAVFRATFDRALAGDAAAWDATAWAVSTTKDVLWVLDAVLHVAEVEEGVGGQAGQPAHLLRDLFGPLPFREVRLDPSWLVWNDCIVKRLAEGIYAERRFGDMGVLADALADAGCDNEDLLRHCRERGLAHCRGCWAVDLILGKA
jgi:hypothetical protein